jgi:hypothetical protein
MCVCSILHIFIDQSGFFLAASLPCLLVHHHSLCAQCPPPPLLNTMQAHLLSSWCSGGGMSSLMSPSSHSLTSPVNQSINVPPVAMKLIEVMPAIHYYHGDERWELIKLPPCIKDGPSPPFSPCFSCTTGPAIEQLVQQQWREQPNVTQQAVAVQQQSGGRGSSSTGHDHSREVRHRQAQAGGRNAVYVCAG